MTRAKRWTFGVLVTTATVALVGCLDATGPINLKKAGQNVVTITVANDRQFGLDTATRSLIMPDGRSVKMPEAAYNGIRRGFNSIARGDQIFNLRLANADFRAALKAAEGRPANLRLDGIFTPSSRIAQNVIITDARDLKPRNADWVDWDACQVAIDTWRTEYNMWVSFKNLYAHFLDKYNFSLSMGDQESADTALANALALIIPISNQEISMLARESFRDAICATFTSSGGSGGGTLAPGADTSLHWASQTVHCEAGYGSIDIWDEYGVRVLHWDGPMTGCFNVDQT